MKKRIIQILLVIFGLVFIYSSIKVCDIYFNLSNDQKEFELLKEEIEVNSNHNDSVVLSKYQKLYEENNDLIGWIKIEGTSLDYPVMYTPSKPEYYLRRNFKKESSFMGVPFIDEECMIDSSNLIIYGHNMKNDTMFSTLLKYKDFDFYKEHKIITFDTIYEENSYEIIGTFYSKVSSLKDDDFKYYKYTDLDSKEIFSEYYNQVKENSLYDTKVEASYKDKLITLSTCDDSVEDGRFVVVAKLIS